MYLPGIEFCCCCGVYGECPGVTQAPPGLGDTDVDVGATGFEFILCILCG